MDVYDIGGELMLCHGYCDLGSQPLIEGLQEIDDFLTSQEVIDLLKPFNQGL